MRESKKPAAPQASVPAAPSGTRLTKFVGPGTLNPGAGKVARRTEQPVYCGKIAGMIYDTVRRTSRADETKENVAFLGSFLAIKADGTQLRPVELYVPGIVQGSFEAMVRRNPGGAARVAFEVWAEPDETTTIGYHYSVHTLIQDTHDPVMDLAYEVGLLERPAPLIEQRAAADPDDGAPDYDPETGEIRS